MTKVEFEQSLLDAIDKAKQAVEAAGVAWTNWKSLPANNAYETLEDAEEDLHFKLREMAAEDCEGSYNVGADTYKQVFIVDGVYYLGVLRCEYNRHDKRYYYVEESRFTYTKIEDPSAYL